MINKFVDSVAEALADTPDGATVLIGGFGTAGIPDELIEGLLVQGAKDLTVVNNNAGNGDQGLAALLKAGRVRKVLCSFPRQTDSYVFDGLYRSGQVELELVPQGNLAERIRAAGAGIGGFFSPTGYGTDLKSTQHTNVQVPSAHHGEAVSMVKISTALQQCHRLFARIDQVVIFLASGRRRAHAQNAVLAVQQNFQMRRHVIGHQGRLSNA